VTDVQFYYRKDEDAFAIQFFAGHAFPEQATAYPMKPQDGLPTIHIMMFSGGRIALLVIADATRWLPAAVLKQVPQARLTPWRIAEEADALLLPFFPETPSIGRRLGGMELPESGSIDFLLAGSGRIVGVIIRNASKVLPSWDG
jgi:hypothetical protein